MIDGYFHTHRNVENDFPFVVKCVFQYKFHFLQNLHYLFIYLFIIFRTTLCQGFTESVSSTTLP